MTGISSYPDLGQSGLKLMSKAMNTAGAAAERVMGSVDPLDIAKTSMDMSEAKAQMAVGAYLIKTQNELLASSLSILDPSASIYGVGTRYDGRF